jgi:hypothetical protein
MTEQSNQSHLEALRRAAELELRWQDARAQRQRASALFSGDETHRAESLADDDEY